MRVLIVEDYEPLLASLAQGLGEEGFAVEATADGREAKWHLEGGGFDAVVLDLMVPGIDGLTLLRWMRRRGVDTPVLILTARGDVDDRVGGLDAGADDYLVKPFAFDELLARLRALLRRGYGRAENVLRCGALSIDTRRRCVGFAGRVLDLTVREYELIEAMAYRQGEALSRDRLRQHLYRESDEPQSNAIDVHIAHLRRKLDAAGAAGYIHTRRGLGYTLGEPTPCDPSEAS